MRLTFKVKNQELTFVKKESLANKSHNILQCVFDFKGEDWEDKQIFALLFDSNRDVYQLHVENNTIIIPSDITKGNKFKLSLYGEDLTPKRITTNRVTINLRESGYTTEIKDLEDIDPDIWTQIFNAIDGKSDSDHTHVVNDISDFPILSNVATSGDYADLNNKPNIPSKTSDLVNDGDGHNIFVKNNDSRLSDNRNPKPHNHSKNDIVDFPESMPPTSHNHSKVDIVDFPAAMPPTKHTHNKVDITDFEHSHTTSDISDFPLIPSKVSDLTNDLNFIGKSNIKGLLKNDGTVDTTKYLTQHQDITGKLDKMHTNFKGKNVVVSKLTGEITFEDKPVIPTKISDLTDDSDFIEKSDTTGLVKNDGTIDTTQYISQHQDLSNYIQKNNTAGLIKNDGTIDTSTYLTEHQDISGKVNYTDIVDNLTTNDSEKPLSAKQGKALAEMIGDIQTYVNR